MNWQELTNESTENLIELIRSKGDVEYHPLAEAAFVCFTFRFSKVVIDMCRKIGRKWNYDQDTADALAEQVFERFWKYPTSFNQEKCKALPLDDCVRFYLFRIAQHCFADHHRTLSDQEKSPYTGEEAVVIDFPSLDASSIDDDTIEAYRQIQNIIDTALATLTPKHKVIYLTYKAYEKSGFKLPRTLLEQLRKELDLSQGSIRAYKKAAFDTVNEHLKLHAVKSNT